MSHYYPPKKKIHINKRPKLNFKLVGEVENEKNKENGSSMTKNSFIKSLNKGDSNKNKFKLETDKNKYEYSKKMNLITMN